MRPPRSTGCQPLARPSAKNAKVRDGLGLSFLRAVASPGLCVVALACLVPPCWSQPRGRPRPPGGAYDPYRPLVHQGPLPAAVQQALQRILILPGQAAAALPRAVPPPLANGIPPEVLVKALWSALESGASESVIATAQQLKEHNLLGPGHAALLMGRAYTWRYFREKRERELLDRARPFLQEALGSAEELERPHRAAAALALSAVCAELGDRDAQLASARQGCALTPESPSAWMCLANALREASKEEEAVRAYAQIRELVGAAKLGRDETVLVLVNIASALLRTEHGQPQGLDTIRELKALDEPASLYLSGQLDVLSGRYEHAAINLLEVVRRLRESELAQGASLVCLGEAYGALAQAQRYAGSPGRALASCDEGLQTPGKAHVAWEPRLLMEQAACYGALGRDDEASEALKRAFVRNPSPNGRAVFRRFVSREPALARVRETDEIRSLLD